MRERVLLALAMCIAGCNCNKNSETTATPTSDQSTLNAGAETEAGDPTPTEVDEAEAAPEAAEPLPEPAAALLAPEKAKAKAPAKFRVKLATTQGDIVVDVTRAWAPKGADRFYNLVKLGFFDGSHFFRVLDGFVAQGGLNPHPKVNAAWQTATLADDPVKESNKRGTITFATSGPNSRTTQFFINFADNGSLDQMGFAPFGKVEDMQVADKLYKGYGEGAPRGAGPDQGRVRNEGAPYLDKAFPRLDKIKKASIIKP